MSNMKKEETFRTSKMMVNILTKPLWSFRIIQTISKMTETPTRAVNCGNMICDQLRWLRMMEYSLFVVTGQHLWPLGRMFRKEILPRTN